LICAESVESIRSHVRVSKPAVLSATDGVKLCSTGLTNGVKFSPPESSLIAQLMASPEKESDVTDETESSC